MDNKGAYAGLNFRRTRPRISKRWAATLAVPVLFYILWSVFPVGQLLFLMLLLLGVLTWIASYGWDEAYARFISFLQRHQNH